MGTIKRKSFLKRSSVRKKRTGPPRRGRLIDDGYKGFIANLPCMVCVKGATERGIPQASHTEVAHVGTRGLGQKCSDRETIPLCAHHHRTLKTAIHVIGRPEFERVHGVNIEAEILRLNEAYEQETSAGS